MATRRISASKPQADLIKEYSTDSLSPAIVAPGKQTFTWSAEKLDIDGAYMTLLINGAEFNIVFAPNWFGYAGALRDVDGLRDLER